MVYRNWKMDPDEDVFLPSGDYLRPGMRIIYGGEILGRVELRPLMDRWDWDRARKSNTWVTLLGVERSRNHSEIMKLHVKFDDGEETNWTYNESFAWTAKRDSIPTDAD